MSSKKTKTNRFKGIFYFIAAVLFVLSAIGGQLFYIQKSKTEINERVKNIEIELDLEKTKMENAQKILIQEDEIKASYDAYKDTAKEILITNLNWLKPLDGRNMRQTFLQDIGISGYTLASNNYEFANLLKVIGNAEKTSPLTQFTTIAMALPEDVSPLSLEPTKLDFRSDFFTPNEQMLMRQSRENRRPNR